MSDIDFEELYGLKAEQTKGEKEQKPAEPAETDDKPKEETSSDGKQTKEENARYAAARRKAEAQTDAAVKAARDKIIKEMNLTSPYTGEKIATAEQYDAYRAETARRQTATAAKKIGISEDDLASVIESSPEVKRLREEINRLKGDEIERENETFDDKVDGELKEIADMIPEYDSLDKIVSGDHGDDFRKYVDAGLSFKEAFRAAYSDEIIDRNAKTKASVKTANESGKGHLTSTVSRGGTFGAEPDEATFDLYRALNPDMSDDEIRADYAKQSKNYFNK